MRPISAADAITPAFRRMGDLLLRPFRVGTFLKVSFVAMLAEVGCISFAVQMPLQALMVVGQALGQGKQLPRGPSTGFAAAMLIMAAILAVLWFLLGYVSTRLRFVVFDFVVGRRTQVAESWRLFGRASWRYFGLNLLVVLAMMTVLISVAAPFVVGFIRAVRINNPAAIMPHRLALMLGTFAAAILVQVVDSVLRDFFLPQMALEDAAIEQAFSGSFQLLRESPGEVALYLLLKFGVTLGFGMALGLALVLCIAVVGAVFFGIGFTLFHMLWASGAGARAVVVAYIVVAALILAVLYVVGIIAASGLNGLFRTAYAAYFYGSRYRPLGDQLDPAPPAAPPEEPLQAPFSPPLPLPPPVW